MATNNIEICNAALSRVGAPFISALTDTDKRSKLCNLMYDRVRKKLLRSHPWNFAMKRAELVNNGIEPAFGYSNEFALPSDYLRAISSEHSDDEYKIEGNYLRTNETEVKLLYIADIEDTEAFDVMFDELFALTLAFELSYSLVQSVSLKQGIASELVSMLRTTRSIDAQEGTPDDFEFDVWLDARN